MHDPGAAIALAKTNNVICSGASFVAWDEAEKVVVSRERLRQPSMKMGEAQFAGICYLIPPSADERHRMGFRDTDPSVSAEGTMERNTINLSRFGKGRKRILPPASESRAIARQEMRTLQPTESFWQQIVRTVLELKHGVDLPPHHGLRDRLLKLIHRLQSLRQYQVFPDADALFEALARWCAWDKTQAASLETGLIERRIGEVEMLLDQFNVSPGNEATNVNAVREWLDRQHVEDQKCLEPVRQWLRDITTAEETT